MRLFVLGAPCSGKTTVAGLLRGGAATIVDVDDEMVRRNGGVWPAIEAKDRLLGDVLEAAATEDEIVVLNSYMPLERTRWLRAHGFAVVLLDVPVAELRRRDDVRMAAEGWTNREWADWHQDRIEEHRDADLVDHVVDGGRPAGEVADDLRRLLHPSGS